jgi:hypothetical protein
MSLHSIRHVSKTIPHFTSSVLAGEFSFTGRPILLHGSCTVLSFLAGQSSFTGPVLYCPSWQANPLSLVLYCTALPGRPILLHGSYTVLPFLAGQSSFTGPVLYCPSWQANPPSLVLYCTALPGRSILFHWSCTVLPFLADESSLHWSCTVLPLLADESSLHWSCTVLPFLAGQSSFTGPVLYCPIAALPLHQSMKVCGGVKYKSTHSEPINYMKVSGNACFLATLSRRK